MGSSGPCMSFSVHTNNAPEQPDAQGHIRSSPSKPQQHSSAGVAAAAHAQQQRSSTQAFDQQLPSSNAFGAGASHPLQQQGARDARSMGDQTKQQQPSAAGPADAGPPAAAAPAPAPTAAWASFMSGFQQAYASPGARAGTRRASQQRKGATPRGSRMQQQQQRPPAAAAAGAPPAQAAAGFGSLAGPMFAFGSPMQQAGETGAAGAAGVAAAAAAAGAATGAAGATPAPSTLPPGSAMSMDTSLPTAFTAAFSAMSVDAATPAAFGINSSAGGSSQQWAFRGPRAAAVTGKRLFDTPSSAGGPGDSSSTPSPFGSWGRPGAQDGSAQQAAAPSGASRGCANPVPFPGFGGAQDGMAPGVSSPAGGFAFNPGKPSPMTSGRKGRHSRGSPAAHKPPPAPPAFRGFGSPAFAAPAISSASANSSASAATPAMASGGSFQGFFGGGAKGPGSAASTPGFSPMMWSPAEAQAAGAAAATGAAATASPAAAAAAAPGAGVGFGAVSGRAQSAAAWESQADPKLQQAAQQLSQQQQQASTAAAAAGAAAVDLPSDDSTESVAELLADLSASGNRAAAAARPETAAMAGLREAVEQLSTTESQQQQQQQHHQALPSFMFGSPADTGAGGGSGSAWLSSPGDAGISPTTLFEMSPLKSAGATNQQKQDAAASAAAAAPSQQQPAAPAAPPAAPPAPQPGISASGPAPVAAAATGFGVFGAGTSGPAAPSFGVGAAGGGGGAAAAGGGFSFTPGKAAGSSRGPGRPRKPTPTKQHKGPAAAPRQDWGSAPFNSSAAAGQQPSRTFVGQQQQEEDSDEGPQAASVFGNFGGSSNPFAPQQEQQQGQQQQQQPAAGSTPGRRKLHAQPRRANQPQSQQQQQQQQWAGATHAWPPSAAQQTWPSAAPAVPAPAAVKLQFTLGTGKAKAGAGSTPVKSPRKARPAPAAQQGPPQPQQQQQQQGRLQPSAQLQDALRQADVWTQRAQASFAAQNWSQADGEFQQGMAALQPYREQLEGAQKLSSLHMHRAAVRIGGGDPQGALRDSLEAIKLHKKNIEAYLRTATCLSKLGCLTAADRVLDKVLDMISARHDSWQALNRKRQQVHQLAHKQLRVVAAALGCDSGAAAATLAALSAGQPVQELLQGFVSTCSARHSGAGTAAAVAALSGAGIGPLEDAAAVQELVADAQSLITELGYWEDGTAMLAWLLLRSGQLGRAASIADAHPNAFFEKQPLHSNKQWGWRWWVLAQVRWQQGELTVAKQLLQEGQTQLQKLAQHANSSSTSSGLWRLLLPAEQELPELLQQLQQLLSLKEAGNAAIQAKQYDKAAEAYTKALALQPSCGFAAVIHSNRAAALQQQKRLVEALADCSRAVALDPKYARAYLRMAQVLESLHRADRAVVVLQDALKGAANAVDPATTRGHELTHGAALLQLGSADRRKFEDMLATAQVAARRFKTPHHYKTLGLAMGATEADIRKAYRALALKHHPDKALQHCRWSARLGTCGAAAAHLTAPSGGVEASLKAAANEIFGLLSSAHEELTNATSRSKVDRDLRTEEQLYSNNSSSSSYSRPAAYTYAYGGRRADSDYGFEDFFRRTAAAGGGSGSGGAYGQSQTRARPGGSSAAGGGGGARSGGAGGGAAAGRGGQAGGGSRWYENNYWGEEDEGDLESDEDEYDYGQGYGQSGWHYSNPRSKY